MTDARAHRPTRLPRLLAALLLLALILPALPPPAPALAAPAIDRFGIDLADMFVLGGFTAGPDGAMWFTQSDGTTESAIGRLLADGTISALVSYPAILEDMTLGPDGNLWATAHPAAQAIERRDHLVRITPQLETTRFPLPNAGSGPTRIVAGPDGALWFTETLGNRIGRITTGGALSEYPLPTPESAPTGIVVGPDGALWFIAGNGSRLARITTGGAISELAPIGSGSRIASLAAGPDGRLWFSDTPGKRLGALAPGGAPTFYPLSVVAAPFTNPAYVGPGELVAGPDGNLWMLSLGGNRVLRVTTSGAQTTIALAFPDRPLDDIAVGPDGRIWYAKTGRIGAITTAGQVSEWQYGSYLPPTLIPATDGGAWLLAQRGFLQTERRLARLRANGILDWLDLSALPPDVLLHGATIGPDGALWCFISPTGSNSAAPMLGRIADDGAITTTPLPPLGGAPGRLVFGPDGNRWFLLYASQNGPGPYSRVARLTPAGQLATFPLDDAFGIDYPLYAAELLVGPDDNLWFTGPRSDVIGRITTAGQIATFPIATGKPDQFVRVGGLTRGQDGNLWFSGSIYDRTLPADQTFGFIGKLTTGGQASFFPITSPNARGYATIPNSLVAGPDGGLWFTMGDRVTFHKLTPEGRIIDYQVALQLYTSTHDYVAATQERVWFLRGNTAARIRTGPSSTLTTRATGDGSVGPGGTYPTGRAVSLAATPGAGSALVGWRVDGRYRGWANPLSVVPDGPTTAEAIFALAAALADLPGGDPAAVAARELATRGIMPPLSPERCAPLGLAAPCFGAAAPLDRLAGAMILARSIPLDNQDGPGIGPRTWRDMPGPSSRFPDRCPASQGCVPDDEWRSLSYLVFRGVVKGYEDHTVRPFDPLLQVHGIALISRAMVAQGYWQPQPPPAPPIAGGLPAIHQAEVATYLHYVGSLPDAPDAGLAWPGWRTPSTRGWYARALWAALAAHWAAAPP